jgi:AcrR family transcriptional regulator
MPSRKASDTLLLNSRPVKRPRQLVRGRDTKTLILDAAEALFAADSYDAVSVRDIANRAGIRLGLASYHFKTKEALFEAVIARRAGILQADRIKALSAVRVQGDRAIPAILAAYVRPFLDRRMGSDEGWRHYSALAADVTGRQKWLKLVTNHYDTTAKLFIDALCAAVPEVSRAAIIRGFVFVIQLTISAISETTRINALSTNRVCSDDFERKYDRLMVFLIGGFQAICQDGHDNARRSSRRLKPVRDK